MICAACIALVAESLLLNVNMDSGKCKACGTDYHVLHRVRHALEKPMKNSDGPMQLSFGSWTPTEDGRSFKCEVTFRMSCYRSSAGAAHIRIPGDDVCQCGATYLKRDIRGTVVTHERAPYAND